MRYVYAVFVPEDTGLDHLYSTPSKAIARLKAYGDVPRGAITALRQGKFVYSVRDEADTAYACRLPIL